MINLISNNKLVEGEFACSCKESGIAYGIIERMVELFANFKNLKNSTIIVDYKSLKSNEIVKELLRVSPWLKNAILLCDEDCREYANNYKSSNLEEVIAVASDREKNRNKHPIVNEVELDCVLKDLLDGYGFSNKYDGYKYIKSICKNMAQHDWERFSVKEEIDYIAKEFTLTNKSNIERNIRYVIEMNENIEIAKIRSRENKVSIKSVIAFLADELEEQLKR